MDQEIINLGSLTGNYGMLLLMNKNMIHTEQIEKSIECRPNCWNNRTAEKINDQIKGYLGMDKAQNFS